MEKLVESKPFEIVKKEDFEEEDLFEKAEGPTIFPNTDSASVMDGELVEGESPGPFRAKNNNRRTRAFSSKNK